MRNSVDGTNCLMLQSESYRFAFNKAQSQTVQRLVQELLFVEGWPGKTFRICPAFVHRCFALGCSRATPAHFVPGAACVMFCSGAIPAHVQAGSRVYFKSLEERSASGFGGGGEGAGSGRGS